jgi:hypothetical protein
LVPERCDKGVPVRIAVNMPEQIQEESVTGS